MGTRVSLGPQVMKQWRQAMLHSVPVSWNQTVSSALKGSAGACSPSRTGGTASTGRRTLTRQTVARGMTLAPIGDGGGDDEAHSDGDGRSRGTDGGGGAG